MAMDVITLGGGCFWCVEAVLQRLNGVEQIVSGYANGKIPNPTYKDVCTGTSGYVEVVQVHFNAEILPLESLLAIFMTTHDPTTLNRQGADKGTQYRSAILYTVPAQLDAANKVIASIQPYFDQPIVTEVEPLAAFYPAESYHQNYYNTNPHVGYCRVVIDPKIKKLQALYSHQMK